MRDHGVETVLRTTTSTAPVSWSGDTINIAGIGTEETMEADKPNWHLRAILVVGVIKMIAIAAIEPVQTPDSKEYIQFARMIVASRTWLSEVDLRSTAIPLEAWRSFGYPFLIAAAMKASLVYWQYIIVWIQAAFALYANYRLGLALSRLTGSLALGITTTVALGLGHLAILDAYILTDSLHASALVLATALIMSWSTEPMIRMPSVVAIGSLFAMAFILREALDTLIVLYIPLIVAIELRRNANLKRAGIIVLLLIGPVWLASLATRQWNLVRIGHAVTTTGVQTALLFPVLEAANIDPTILDGAGKLEFVLRAYKSAHPAPQGNVTPWVYYANRALHAEFGLTAPEIARQVQSKYWSTWQLHPRAMLRAMIGRVISSKPFLIIRPFALVRDAMEQAENQDRTISLAGRIKRQASAILEGRIKWLPILIFELVGIVLSAALITIGFLGSVRSMARVVTSKATGFDHVVLALWIVIYGYFGAYAAVNIEWRYFAPIVPLLYVAVLLQAYYSPLLRRRRTLINFGRNG